MPKLNAKQSLLNTDEKGMIDNRIDHKLVTNKLVAKIDSHHQPDSSVLSDDLIYKKWQAFIEAKIGFVLPQSQTNWLWQAINRLARETQYSQSELLAQAMKDEALTQKVVNAVLIPQSQFFRHQSTLDFISDCAKQKSSQDDSSLTLHTASDTHQLSTNHLVNDQYHTRKASTGKHCQTNPCQRTANGRSIDKLDNKSTDFMVWSVGCSFGQEVWSIAMTLEELHLSYQVWGADVNTSALHWAETGNYGLKQLSEIPSLYRKYIEIDDEHWSIVPKLRQHTHFFYYNLIDSTLPHLPLVDIIICQNVLIYFRQFEQRDILARLVKQLKVGGHLILAPEDANQWRHPSMARDHDLRVNAWEKVK